MKCKLAVQRISKQTQAKEDRGNDNDGRSDYRRLTELERGTDLQSLNVDSGCRSQLGRKNPGSIDPSYGGERFHRELLAIEFRCGWGEATVSCPRMWAMLVSIRINALRASS